MKIIIFDHQQAVAEAAAALIQEGWKRKPDLVLGLAAGRTPLELYRLLVEFYHQGKIDFSRMRVFGLDEFFGLERTHPLSFAAYFEENLFRHVNLPPDNIHLLDGKADNVEAHCRWYEAMIQRCGGIDIQLLGLGQNGHLGFNEPGSSFGSRTRLQALSEETMAVQASLFQAQGMTPPQASLTMGLATILEAKNILLLVTGEEKARILPQALEGPLTASVPASCLQLHSSVFVLLDEAAAAGLKRKNHYRQIQNLINLVPRLD